MQQFFLLPHKPDFCTLYFQ